MRASSHEQQRFRIKLTARRRSTNRRAGRRIRKRLEAGCFATDRRLPQGLIEMIVRMLLLLLFWGIGFFALREARSDVNAGVGRMGFSSNRRTRRQDDPVGFWFGVANKLFTGIFCLAAGAAFYIMK